MKKLSLRSAAFVIALCLLTVGFASANTIPQLGVSFGSKLSPAWPVTSSVPFPTAGDAFCAATSGCGTIPSGGQSDFMWTAGDYVISSVFHLAGNNAIGLSANWQFQDYLGNGNTETWYVYVNGVAVAQAKLPDDSYNGDILTVGGSVSFAPIKVQNGGFQVELVLQNTVPVFGGSAAWLDGGATGITTIPEPGTLVMFGSAALGLAGLLRRKLGL